MTRYFDVNDLSGIKYRLCFANYQQEENTYEYL